MKVSFYTLGCKVNQYETQMIRERFESAGYETVEKEEQADICIINTCTVTNLSDRKSRQRIRRVRDRNENALIVVTGCYAQTNAETAASIPGVSIVVGTNEKSRIVDFVEEFLNRHRETGFYGGSPDRQDGGGTEKTVRTDPEGPAEMHVLSYGQLTEYEESGSITYMDSRTRAYIKIQDGCDRFCSYCIIPYARGHVRSRRIGEIVNEAKELIARGFHEIVLTGINTALYGVDLTEEEILSSSDTGLRGIEAVVSAVSELEGEFRIRLSSLEPNVIDEDTARRLNRYPKLCPHMHLSLQSGSDTVLARMNRRYDMDTYRRIVDIFRERDPNFAVTTDIIAGFPGETEEEFEESLRAVREIGFCRVHAFRYSRRSGTKADRMKDQIGGAIKNARVGALIREGEQSAEKFFRGNIGSVRRVLFERYHRDTSLLTGLTDNYISVYCPAQPEEAESLLNRFSDVKLERLYEDGMSGTIV